MQEVAALLVIQEQEQVQAIEVMVVVEAQKHLITRTTIIQEMPRLNR